ncbi:MAG: protein kinase, partial [Tabrizicola sp.]|nr:protein kinase [Tabrizicola sp.]
MAPAAMKNTTGENQDFADELKPGTKLMHGQYTIEEFLNSGGFGITYLARDSLDRRVVIKECFPGSFCRRSRTTVGARSRAHQAEFRSIVKLFVQEAFNLSKLKHPNIVGVHQVFEDNDTAYMAMDFVEGSDLAETLDGEANRLSPPEVMAVLEKILDAVRFIHGKGLLHRDISPDNILIDRKSSNPVLIDFGAAREEVSKASRALSAMRVVKDGYSPQEFYINGSPQGPSSDLYAVGATFYHLITGKTAPNSQLRVSSIASQQSDPYEPLGDSYEGYPPAFLRAIDKSLNVFPKDRIQSADEWLAMIGSDKAAPGTIVLPESAQTSVPTRQISSMIPAQMKSSKGMLVASAAAIAIVAGLAAAASGVFSGGDTATKGAEAAPETSAPAVAPPPKTAEVAPKKEVPPAAKAPIDDVKESVAKLPDAMVPRLPEKSADAEEAAKAAAAKKSAATAALPPPSGVVLPDGVELIAPPKVVEAPVVAAAKPEAATPEKPPAKAETAGAKVTAPVEKPPVVETAKPEEPVVTAPPATAKVETPAAPAEAAAPHRWRRRWMPRQ